MLLFVSITTEKMYGLLDGPLKCIIYVSGGVLRSKSL